MEQEGRRAEGRGHAGPAAAAGPLLRARARRSWSRRMRRPRGWRSGAARCSLLHPSRRGGLPFSPSPAAEQARAAIPFSRRGPSPAPARGRRPLLPWQSRPAPAPMDWARAPELARPRPRRRGARLPAAGAAGLDPDEADEATGEEVRGGGVSGEDEVERGARVCSASAWAAAARKTTRRGRGSSSAYLACPRPGSVGEEGEKGKEARSRRDPPKRRKARPPLLRVAWPRRPLARLTLRKRMHSRRETGAKLHSLSPRMQIAFRDCMVYWSRFLCEQSASERQKYVCPSLLKSA